jgi:putative flippase GtrA
MQAAESGRDRLAELLVLGGTLIRFLLVGAANTAVGFGVTMALEFALGLSPQLANAGGYAVGAVLSFFLNRRFVFGTEGHFGPAAARFALGMLAAFILNQIVLLVLTHRFGSKGLAAAACQIVAMASYTLAFFVLCRWWVFRAPRPGAGE